MAAREDDGRKHHIGIKHGEVGRYVLLPGDPDRVEVIASRFDNPKFLMRRREYTTWTGELDGVPVACTSTGIGCPSTAIAVEELADVVLTRSFELVHPAPCSTTSSQARSE